MRDGQMIVLADIAASTLGIALLLLTIVYAGFGTRTVEPTTRERLESQDIAQAFKPVTAAPLSANTMIQHLHGRSRASPDGTRSIEVFADRIELRLTGINGAVEAIVLQRDASDFGSRLNAALSDAAWREKPVPLFLFSNQLFNVVYDAVAQRGIEIAILNIPRALVGRDSSGNTGWSRSFSVILKKDQPVEAFTNDLASLLAGEEPATQPRQANTGAGENAGSGGVFGFGEGITQRVFNLYDRVIAFLSSLGIGLLLISAAALILVTEWRHKARG
ncbi:MAG: hypothetical protein AAGE89_07845 [Pseudomonadota bacterium]